MKNPKCDIKEFKKILEEIIKEDDSDSSGPITSAGISAMILDHLETNEVEIVRLKTEFTAHKPNKQGTEYICLRDILIPGFKNPYYDEQGRCEPRPVFNSVTPILVDGPFNLVSPDLSYIQSDKYYRYADEAVIIFRENDCKLLFFSPDANESVCIKISGLEGYTIKDELKDSFNLEFVYLMMNNPEFYSQFRTGLNTLSLLNGWIPRIPLNEQNLITEEFKSNIKKLKV